MDATQVVLESAIAIASAAAWRLQRASGSLEGKPSVRSVAGIAIKRGTRRSRLNRRDLTGYSVQQTYFDVR